MNKRTGTPVAKPSGFHTHGERAAPFEARPRVKRQ